LIVAGGDDLCLVMDERYMLKFAESLSTSVNEHIATLPPNHPLHPDWLNSKSERNSVEPYGFGAAFIITPVHTPFSRIHEVGEALMKEAKIATKRKANSINWRIMAEADSLTEQLLTFERPIFINHADPGIPNPPCLPFVKYLGLVRKYKKILSTSHIQQLVSWMLETDHDAEQLEIKMMKGASSELEKSYSELLTEKALRRENGTFMPSRLATLLELISIEEKTE
jgi:hypothetical protein